MKTIITVVTYLLFFGFIVAVAQTTKMPSPTPSSTTSPQWQIVVATDPVDNIQKTNFVLQAYTEGGNGLGTMGFACWDAHDPKLWGRTFLLAVPFVKVNSNSIEFQIDDEATFSKTAKGIIPNKNVVFFDLVRMDEGWKELLPRILQAKRLRLTAAGDHSNILLEFRPAGIDLERFRSACNLPGLLPKGIVK